MPQLHNHPDPGIYAVHHERRVALWEDGDVTMIEQYFDFEGDETDDPDEAVSAIGEKRIGQKLMHFCIDLTKFKPMKIH